MRIGGLATGIDTDHLLKELMQAERIPLDKMHQDRQKIEWQRDGFREVNRALKELDSTILKMRLQSSYKTKDVSSNQGNAITAEAGSKASDGNYRIEVKELATSAMVSGKLVGNDILKGSLGSHDVGGDADYQGQFYTYENGEEKPHSFEVKTTDTLDDVLERITKDDNNVRAFIDEKSGQVVFETMRTGQYRPKAGLDTDRDSEIYFKSINDENSPLNSFFTETIKMDVAEGKGGTDASFTYNGHLELTSHDNSYEINNIKMQFHDVTNGSANLVVQNNTEGAFDNIMEFVDKYNEVVELVNKTQQEERYRDFPPLTDEQKSEMSEDQIKKWEEKAQSGLLKGDSTIKNSLFNLRRELFDRVDSSSVFGSLSEIGLESSKNYLDGGKIVLKDGSPDKLKAALNENIEDVTKLFTNSEDGKLGIMQKLDKTVKSVQSQISKRAGGVESSSLENYALGKQMKNLNEQITNFERRLVQVETRYWNQFTAMESAIQRMNAQSSQLMEQFGGGM